MKSIPSVVIIVLLLFACKLCSFTGTKDNSPSTPTPTPTPRPLLYANDLIRQQLGPFVLIKHSTREEMRKTAAGFTATLVEKSNDAGIGVYRSDKIRSAILSVYSFPTRETVDSVVDHFQSDMRQSKKWTLVKTAPAEQGKRLEALGVLNGKASGLVLWSNGQWLFMTTGDGLTEARLLADAVGY